MRLLERLGLAPLSEVRNLQNQVASLEVRQRFGRGVASGVDITYGSFEYEFNAKMRGSEKWETLEKMEADPHVKAALRFNSLPLINAKWQFKPATDDPRDEEIAEFCDANLLRGGGDTYGREYWSQTSWKAQRLPEILDMLRSGFAMFHKSKRVVGNKRVFDRIQWLEPASVDPHGWKLDEADNLLNVARTYKSATDQFRFAEPMQADEIALYVWDLRGARFEGRPLVRSMYGPWFRKDILQRVAVIWAQKVGAPPPVGYYLRGWDAATVARWEQFIQSLRGQAPAHAWGSFPKDADGQSAEVKFPGVDAGEVDRLRGLINGENLEIAHAGDRKAESLGETTSGSRALGESIGRVEMLSVQAIAEIICEWENHGVGNLRGLVEELVDDNFAGVKAYPELYVSKVNPLEGLETLEPLVKAVQAGLVPRHPELMRQVTERLGFTLPDEAYEVEEVEDELPPDGAAQGAGEAEGDRANGEKGDGAPAKAEGASPQGELAASLREEVKRMKALPEGSGVVPADGGRGAKPRGWFRAPTEFEARFVALGEIERETQMFQDRYFAVATHVLRRAGADLVERIRKGIINQRNYSGLRMGKVGPNVKYRAELRRAVLGIIRQAGKFGERQVAEELRRQEAEGD